MTRRDVTLQKKNTNPSSRHLSEIHISKINITFLVLIKNNSEFSPSFRDMNFRLLHVSTFILLRIELKTRKSLRPDLTTLRRSASSVWSGKCCPVESLSVCQRNKSNVRPTQGRADVFQTAYLCSCMSLWVPSPQLNRYLRDGGRWLTHTPTSGGTAAFLSAPYSKTPFTFLWSIHCLRHLVATIGIAGK